MSGASVAGLTELRSLANRALNVAQIVTELADRRLRAGLTQEEISALTGDSLAHYRRLERGQITNPPLRFLVNCALVLRVDLFDVIEDQWLQWMPFDHVMRSRPSALAPHPLRRQGRLSRRAAGLLPN